MKLIWVQLALGLLQTDLAVKHEMENKLNFGEVHELCGGRIQLKKAHNYGIAGGKFTGHMPTLIKASGLMTLGCIGAFVRLLWKEGHTVKKIGFSLLTGGALSNLYDRCKRGYVVDYISFRTPWKKFNKLIFNLSDFLIFAGALLICLGQTEQTLD